MIRRMIPVAAMFLAAACEVAETPVGPTDPSAQPVLVDGSTDVAHSNVFFLTPLVPKNPKPPTDIAFGAGLSPAVEIRCLALVGGPCPLGPVERWETGDLGVFDKHFQADWHTSDLGATGAGDMYQVVVLLPNPLAGGEMAIASADVEFAANGKDAKKIDDGVMGLVIGQDVPIKFWLGEFALFEALQNACEEALGVGVIDCDIETIPPGGMPDDPLTVGTDPDDEDSPRVGRLDATGTTAYDPECVDMFGFVPACLVAYSIVLEHVEESEIGDTPDGSTAYEFFLKVTLVQLDGSEAILGPPGATLDICQSGDVEDELGGSVFDLQVFKTDNGSSVQIPSTNGVPGGFCEDAEMVMALNEAGPASGLDGSLLRRMASTFGALKRRLLEPPPLFATLVTHGGKRATGLQDFSGFGTYLPEVGPFLYSVNNVEGPSFTVTDLGSMSTSPVLDWDDQYEDPEGMAPDGGFAFLIWNNFGDGQASTDGVLLSVICDGSGPFNLNDAGEVPVGATDQELRALAISGGDYYGVGPHTIIETFFSNYLFLVNESTGEVNPSDDISDESLDGNIVGLAEDPDDSGSLWGLTDQGELVNFGADDGVYSVSVYDLDGAPQSGSYGALAVDEEGELWGSRGSTIFRIDVDGIEDGLAPVTDLTTLDLDTIRGMEFGPDPSSCVIS